MQTVKTIAISSLIIANLASTWLVPLIYVDFELRQDYIAKVLCIERENPITVCKGSCYLSDQLERAAKQQEKEKQVNPVEMIFFLQREVVELPTHSLKGLADVVYPIFVDQKLSNPYLTGVFHPPRS